MKKNKLQDELTTAMHYEFLSDEYTLFEMNVLGVRGMTNRGFSLEEALKKYGIEEKEYLENIDRVLAI